jgi:8-oxo-dGTP pyrophosphatase MutT (NUDIX family)
MRRHTLLLFITLVTAMGAGASAPSSNSNSKPPPPPALAFPPGVEKLGAGLLLCRRGPPDDAVVSILLLKRRSKHHGGAWGLPGGNAEPGEEQALLSTATREAHEELGHAGVPPFLVKARLDTRRGKRGQKLYAVFVAAVDGADVTEGVYAPRLNEEHSAWRWWPAEEVEGVATRAGGSAGGEEEEQDVEQLHPVVVLAMQRAGGAAGLARLLDGGRLNS